MSCNIIESLLSQYIDDALTPTERRQVEGHLQQCAACRQLAEELRDDRSKLQSLLPMLPPSGFREELLCRVANSRPKPSLGRYLVPRLGSLAAAVTMMLLASNLYLVPIVEQRLMANKAEENSLLFGGAVGNTSNENSGHFSAKLEQSLVGDAAPAKASPQEKATGSRALVAPPSSEVEDSSLEDVETYSYGAPPPEERPDYLLWSGLGGFGLFGLGTGFFLYRYRRS